MNEQESKEVQQDFSKIMEETKKEMDFHLWSVQEILTKDFGKEEWLVESLIPLQTITALSGDPGSFKTWLTLELAKSIASGILFLGKFPVKKGVVLIIDEENQLRHIQKRLQQLQIPQDADIFYLSNNEIKIDNPQHLEGILRIVKEKNILLVMFDSLVRIHSGDENAAREMSAILGKLKKITAMGTNILFTHHHRKESSYGPRNPSWSLRGSSDILAIVDCHLSVEKLKNKDKLVIGQTKLRQAEQIKPFSVKIEEIDGKISFQYGGENAEELSKLEQAKEIILQVLTDKHQLSRKELHDHFQGKNIGGNWIDNACSELKETGKIEQVQKEEIPVGQRKQAVYRLTP